MCHIRELQPGDMLLAMFQAVKFGPVSFHVNPLMVYPLSWNNALAC